MSPRPKVVLLGMMTNMPVAGVVWQTLHYLVGFRRLGYEPYYVEAHARNPGSFMTLETDDGSGRAAAFIDTVLRRYDLGANWAYQALHDNDRCYGLGDAALAALYRDAALVVNLHGGTVPRPEHVAHDRLVYLETDPVQLQVELLDGVQETLDFLAPHDAFFSFGENFGNADCALPVAPGFAFTPTRQPVVLDWWKEMGAGGGTTFRTVGNWRQRWREVRLDGVEYSWSKHVEFEKFLDLPQRTGQAFELALSRCEPQERARLEHRGWGVVSALDVSRDADEYRRYIGDARGEWTVAKDQNVRLRTGWFSDRSATFLAARRPVVTQDTGFGAVLPTGEGLFAVSCLDDAVDAVDRINADYPAACRAAWEIAREHFDSDRVIGRMLADLGLPARSTGAPKTTTTTTTPPTHLRKEIPVSSIPTGGDAPIVVVGAPHCGVNILSAALAQHPRVVPALDPPHDEELLDLLAAAEDPERVAEVGDRLGRRLLFASPRYTPHLYRLSRAFPRARFVHVVRDIADAVTSSVAASALPRTDPRLRVGTPAWVDAVASSSRMAPGAASVTTWTAAGQRWLSDVRTCLIAERAFGSSQMLRVYHRDLVADPRGELGRILGWLGEPFEEQCLRPVAVLSPRFAARASDGGQKALPRAGCELSDELSRPPRRAEADAVALERLREVHGGTTGRTSAPSLHRRVRQLAAAKLPAEASVLVISKGDDGLLALDGRCGMHFPQDEDGQYAGYYPGDSAEAIEHLEELRARGADHLLVPQPSSWWLDHYDGLRRHLEQRYTCLDADDAAVLFELRPRRGTAEGEQALPATFGTDGASAELSALAEEPSHGHTFAVTDRTPPTELPVSLPGSLWAVTTFYNPAGYRNKSVNYRRFREHLRAQGVPLLTVEVAFGDEGFELCEDDAEMLVQLRGRDVLWQKERILNLGVSYLPDDCDKVAWLDADILLADGWSEAASAQLERYAVVQPYSHCVRLPREALGCEPAALSFGPGENQLFYAVAFGIFAKGRSSLQSYFKHGHTGYAWTMRRSLFERHGLYDGNLIANGDTDIAHAMFGNFDYWSLRKFGPAAREHLSRWAHAFAADVQGSVGFVDGLVMHLWHGALKDRLYHQALDVLHDFDPDRDLEADPDTGLYRWSEASERLREWSSTYFANRKEEGAEAP